MRCDTEAAGGGTDPRVCDCASSMARLMRATSKCQWNPYS
jgi:hypothetical protein